MSKRVKKLSLNAETLRNLQDSELRRVLGGQGYIHKELVKFFKDDIDPQPSNTNCQDSPQRCIP